MSAICIKNGVNVYFPEYDMWARSDVYVIGNALIVIGNPYRNSEHHVPWDSMDMKIKLFGGTLDRPLANGHQIYIVPFDEYHVMFVNDQLRRQCERVRSGRPPEVDSRVEHYGKQ